MHYVTIALVPFYFALIGYALYKKELNPDQNDIKYLLLFMLAPAWAVLSTAWSFFPALSFKFSIHFFVMTVMLYGLALLWRTYVKENFLIAFLPANIFVVVTGLISLIIGFPADAWDIGHGLSFAGIFTHQNVMASALLFTLPGAFALWNGGKKVKNKFEVQEKKDSNSHFGSFGHSIVDNNKTVLFFLLFTFNFLLIILTYSRAAMLAIGIGVLVYLIFTKAYKTLLTGFAIAMVLLTINLTILPTCLPELGQSINQTVYRLLSKHEFEIMAARTVLWKPSWEAAKLGGITGIGYGVSHPDIKIGNRTNYLKELNRYDREKGNSVLAIVEEIGLIGLIFFILPLIFVFYVLFKAFKQTTLTLTSTSISTTTLSLAFITAALIHSNLEGWLGGRTSVFRVFLIFIFFSLIYYRDFAETVNNS